MNSTLRKSLVFRTPKLFRILQSPHFVNDNGKDINSDWLTDRWDERSALGHTRIHKRKMKDDDPAIATLQNPKQLDGSLARLEKIRKIFTDSILNKKKRGPKTFN